MRTRGAEILEPLQLQTTIVQHTKLLFEHFNLFVPISLPNNENQSRVTCCDSPLNLRNHWVLESQGKSSYCMLKFSFRKLWKSCFASSHDGCLWVCDTLSRLNSFVTLPFLLTWESVFLIPVETTQYVIYSIQKGANQITNFDQV